MPYVILLDDDDKHSLTAKIKTKAITVNS